MKRPVLKLKKLSVSEKINLLKSITHNLKTKKRFKDAAPMVSKFNLTLQHAELVMSNKFSWSQTLHSKQNKAMQEKLLKCLYMAEGYVIGKSCMLEDKEAIKLIRDAGMDVKRNGENLILCFSVKQGPTLSSVTIRCRAIKNTGFIVQQSTDGIHWVDKKFSIRCIFVIDGLKFGKYYFRMATVNGKGQSDWSEVVEWEVR